MQTWHESFCFDHTASTGSDYSATPTTFSFAAGAGDLSTQCLPIMILEDTLVEGSETFTVSLTSSSSVPGVTLDNTLDIVTITDNEGENYFAIAACNEVDHT